VRFLNGTKEPKYAFSLQKPTPTPNLTFSNDALELTFLLDRERLAFSLRNKSEQPIQIDWNSASYVDPAGRAHKVMHEGVKYVDRNSPQPPTVVPPGATIDDRVVPSDHVEYVERSGWLTRALLPAGDEASALQGRTLGVLLPIQTAGTTENLYFLFSIDRVDFK
jgi:hypothetical protein